MRRVDTRRTRRTLALALYAATIAACAVAPPTADEPARPPSAPAAPDGTRSDAESSTPAPAPAPPPRTPLRRPRTVAELAALPEPVARFEPLAAWANQPYTVFGRPYVPMTERRPYRERGVASWYGPGFHGRRTALGERYDMYAISAAHPTLPLPSYVRVRHAESGRSLVVRVNDRGPYRDARVLDLSYAAAVKLGLHAQGTAEVEIELITDFPEALAHGRAVRGIVIERDGAVPVTAGAPARTGSVASVDERGDDGPAALGESRAWATAQSMRTRLAIELGWPRERLVLHERAHHWRIVDALADQRSPAARLSDEPLRNGSAPMPTATSDSQNIAR